MTLRFPGACWASKSDGAVPLILDTHYVYAIVGAPARLSRKEVRFLSQSRERFVVSAVSIWEIRIKWKALHASGQRKGPRSPEQVVDMLSRSPVDFLDLKPSHAAVELTHRLGHADPFDELLLAPSPKRRLSPSDARRETPLAPLGAGSGASLALAVQGRTLRNTQGKVVQQAEIAFGGAVTLEQLAEIAAAIVDQGAAADWAEPPIHTRQQAEALLQDFVAQRKPVRVVCDPGSQMPILASVLQHFGLTYVLDSGPAGDEPVERAIFDPTRSDFAKHFPISDGGPIISLSELRAAKRAGKTLDDVMHELSEDDIGAPPLELV